MKKVRRVQPSGERPPIPEDELLTNRISSITPDAGPPSRLSGRKRGLIAAGAVLLLVIAAAAALLLYTSKMKPSVPAVSGLTGDEKAIGSLSGSMSLQSDNIHIKRGRESYLKKYYADAISEFTEVVESDADSRDRAIALTYMGMIADDRGDYEKAIDYYRRALSLDDNNPEILKNLALAYRHSNRLEEASEQISKSLDISPDDTDTRILRGNILFEQGKFREAADAYAGILEDTPGNAPVMYNLASSLMKQGDEFAAVEYFKKAGATDRIGDIAYRAYNRLGIIFTERGNFELAEENLRKAASIRPNDASVKYNLGIAYLRQGRKEDALREFIQSESLSGVSPELLEGLGDAYFSAGEYGRSLSAFSRLLEIKGRNVRILSRIGEIYYESGEPDKAYEAFRKITMMEPATENARIAYLNMGNILDDTMHYDEAVEAYKKALAISPKEEDVLINLGLSYKHGGKPELAVSSWKKAAELNPQNPAPLLATAGYYYENGFFDLAEEQYRTVISRWPSLQEPHYKMAMIYHKKNQLDYALSAYKRAAEIDEKTEMGRKSLINIAYITADQKESDANFDEAMNFLKKALLIKPGDPEALFASGVLYSKRQMFENAVDMYYQAIKASNDDSLSSKAYGNIGKCRYNQGDFQRAVQAFTRAIELDPANEELRINRKTAAQARENELSLER